MLVNYYYHILLVGENEKNLYFFHSEIHLLYVSAIIILAFSIYFNFSLKDFYEHSTITFWVLLIIGFLLYVTAVITDIRQHVMEWREIHKREIKLELFLRENGFFIE